MIKQFAFCILALGASSAAFGGACVQASLATYIADGSCTVGNYTFNDFTYIAINVLSQNISDADITVNATVVNGQPDVTFTPNSAFSTGGVLSAAEYVLGFQITATTGIDFQSVDLTDTGTVTPGALGIGTGAAAVAEVDCNGGLLSLDVPGEGLLGGVACLGGGISAGANAALPLGTNVSADANIVLSGTSNEVDVLKDVTLGGAVGSTATISGIGQQFTTSGTATPEPASFFLGGCGLIGLALVRRRKGKAEVKPDHSCML